jgi:hypothetical protein
MFEPTSRYAPVETATLTRFGDDGQPHSIPYKRRRFVPPPAPDLTVVEHGFERADRLDTVTARYLGDPTRFWLVCDENDVFRPAELEQIGRAIRIPMPRL